MEDSTSTSIIKSELQKELFRYFYFRDSCIRCILRALKITDQSVYQSREKCQNLVKEIISTTEVISAETYSYSRLIRIDSSISGSSSKNVCVICCGILQELDEFEIIEKVVKYIKGEDFEFNAFKFFVKVPISSVIRMVNMVYMFIKEVANREGIERSEEEKIELNAITDFKKGTVDVKNVVKWVVPVELSAQLGVAAAPTTLDCPFVVNFTVEQQDDDRGQFACFADYLEEQIRALLEKKRLKLQGMMAKKQLKDNDGDARPVPKCDDPSSTNLDRIMKLSQEEFLKCKGFTCPQKPLCEPLKHFTYFVSHGSVFFMGNYCKYSRYMSQTPWLIDGNKLYEKSISEQITEDIIDRFKGNGMKFSSGGREDIDVRMLGKGRPFVIEVLDPRRALAVSSEELSKYEVFLNAHRTEISVNSMKFTDVKCFEQLKSSQEEKIKSYACVVHTKDVVDPELIAKMNAMGTIELKQKTPIRVLHRRTQMVRTKFIYKLKAVPLCDHYLVLYVLSSAGTYIKEFVHGDLERTTPNVGSILGTEVDIFQLDVMQLYPEISEQALLDFDQTSSVPKAILNWE